MRGAYSLIVFALFSFGACSNSTVTGVTGGSGGNKGTGAKDGGTDAPHDAPADVNYDVPVIPPPDGSIMNPCQLPGSVQFVASGTGTTQNVVKGGDPSWPSLTFLHLPAGFCVHYYGNVGNARQLRFAPGGELFVASPTGSTTGGGPNGQAAIVVLPDDNLDGVADTPVTYQSGLPNTQGMLFANGNFYFQDGTKIQRVAYTTGQRMIGGPPQTVANITYYSSGLHWPKTLDQADDGSIYIGNGGDQGETCATPHPFHGGIRKLDPTGANMDGIPIAQGFRNPISVRCSKGHNQCFALELALDYSASGGGREKMVPIHQGDDWGFPCCASHNLPYSSVTPTPDCSGVAQESNAFLIGDTPFGMDFEQGFWPAPWNRNAYVVTHGAAGSWQGARMVSIPTDPSTGMPAASSNTTGTDVGMVDFVTGWDVGSPSLGYGRPAAVAFASDGRLFVANDATGVIFWIATM